MKKLTFAMIVKNAAADLPEILPGMATIADEILIVDTGSSDATVSVAEHLGARVIRHPWDDSFANARNVYVQAARGEFIFSIDADERVADRDLPLIRAAASKPPQGFLMTTRNYLSAPEAQGYTLCRGEYPELERSHAGYAPSTKVRMFARIEGVSYEGAVRELLEPSLERAGLPLGEILAPIHHFGAVTPEKQRYYRELLARKCASAPQNPRHWLELATEDFHLQHFQAAADGMRRSIELFKAGHKAAYFEASGAFNTLGVSLIHLGRYAEALRAFDEGLAAGGPSAAALKRNRALLLDKFGDKLAKRPEQPRRPSLGVIMIVKDEAKNLPGILSDVKSFADEIVVVDTGSSDQTVALAESLGARVGHFEWCDDFAAARNHSIEIAKSDYLLWLDADDRIEASEQARLSALKAELQADQAYYLRVESLTDEAAASSDGFTAFYQLRLFPRRADLRFAGRVHEELATAVSRAGLATATAAITVRHTGYHVLEDRRAKGRRNLAIQLKALHDGQDDAAQHYMIAASCFAVEDYAASLDHIATARSLGGGGLWRKYAYHLACDCRLALHEPERALGELEAGCAAYPQSGLMHYFYGALCVREQLYTEAVQALETAEHLGLEHETFAIPSDVDERLPYFLGLAYQKTGRLDEAQAAFERCLALNSANADAAGGLGLTLLQLGRVDAAVGHLAQARQLGLTADRTLNSALAGAYYHLNRLNEARELYRAAAPEPQAVSGQLLCSLKLDDVADLVAALDRLMQAAGLASDFEIASLEQLAGLLAATGLKLLELGETLAAGRLQEACLTINPSEALGLLLKADLAELAGLRQPAIQALEQALGLGADPAAVSARLQRMEQTC